jgi:hypothetical protein
MTFSPRSHKAAGVWRQSLRFAEAHSRVLVSTRWTGLPAVPERFGFLIAERSLPALSYGELPPHGAEPRCATLAHRHEPCDWTPMALDDHRLTIFNQIEQLRQPGLRAVHADVHITSLVFFGLTQRSAIRQRAKVRARCGLDRVERDRTKTRIAPER